MKEIVGQRASNRRRRSNWELRYPELRRVREKGAIAIMFAVLLIVIFGFFGLALDLSRIYNRRAEMQAVANSAAVSAAKRLNGTSNGISNAVAAARDALEGATDVLLRPKYEYKRTMVFSAAAIMFGRSSDGSTGWLTEAQAMLSPGGLAYVRVETSRLDGYGTVNMLFMPVLSSFFNTVLVDQVTVNHTAVAGRGSIGVTPIAICAMSTIEGERRGNPSGNDELVEYGFRRGVSYDLMKLSSYQDTATNFLVDPIGPPGSSSPASHFDLSTVGPHVCTGTVALPRVSGASIRVQSGFPIADLFHHLNSRFNLSNGRCDPKTAPPDSNIKQYTFSGISWMSPKPLNQSALGETALDNQLRTIADLPPPNNQMPRQYGPLWVYARAVPWSSYIAGHPEPYNGYTPFPATTAIWTSLYSTGPGLGSYPDPTGVTTPYSSQVSGPPPTLPGAINRRVLYVPLVRCPVSGSSAPVLAIGKFFMTVPADGPGASIPAEFGGLAAQQPIAGTAELYP